MAEAGPRNHDNESLPHILHLIVYLIRQKYLKMIIAKNLCAEIGLLFPLAKCQVFRWVGLAVYNVRHYNAQISEIFSTCHMQ